MAMTSDLRFMAERTAQQRSWKNRHHKTHNLRRIKPSETDLVGVMGEIVFARHFGIPLEQVNADGPTTANFTLRDGTRVAATAPGSPRLS